MVVRITSMVLRVCAVLALILGIFFWVNATRGSLVLIHMLLGILVMLSLFILGFFIATVKGGNIGLAIGAVVLGLLMLALGLEQRSLLEGSSDPHWIIQVLHLLLGLLAIGIGETITARYKRLTRANTL